MKPSLRLALALCSLVLCAVLPQSLRAQSQTGTMIFEVTNQDGEPVQGATLTMSSDALQGTQLRETDELGRARFTLLPPGAYFVEVLAEGYITSRRDVLVRLGSAQVERILVAKGDLVETVSVVAHQEVDPTDTGTGTTFTRQYMEKVQIGSAGRSYQAILQQAPGTGGGGNPSVHGATLGENRYLIDGVDTTDPVTGTFGLNANFDAFEQVEFATAGFQAEYGQATGGIVNMVSKSGGDEFHGSLDVRYDDERFYETSAEVPNADDEQSFKEFNGTLGGYIFKEKLWFFLAGTKLSNSSVVSGAPVTRGFDGEDHLAKLTWNINPEHRVSLQYTADPAEITGDNAGVGMTAEAAAHQSQGAKFFKATYWGRVTDNWSVSAQAGRYKSLLDTFPEHGMTAIPVLDLTTGVLSGNYDDAQFSDRFRDQISAQAEWISTSEHWHDVKFGFEYQDVSFEFERQQPGGQQIYLNQHFPEDDDFADFCDPALPPPRLASCDTPQPYIRDILHPVGMTKNTGVVRTLYAQDTWHFRKGMTLDYGLRWDHAAYDNDAKEEVASLGKLQPRVGFAWDIRDDAKHVVRAFLARYMHPAILGLPQQANTRADETERQIGEAYFGDLNGDGDLDDFLTVQTLGGPSGTTIDDGLDATYVDELSVGYRSRVSPEVTFGAAYVARTTKDIIEDTLIYDEGIYRIGNLPGLKRNYGGLELDFSWHLRRFHMIGNWTISKSRGNIDYTQGIGIDFDIIPAHSLNRSGYLPDDRRHRVKVQGWWELPKNFEIAYDFFFASGLPYERLETYFDPEYGEYGDIFLDPRGSHRLPSITELDAEVRKAFDIKNTRLQLIGSIQNVFDRGVVTAVEEHEDESDPFGTPQSYQLPRSYQVGMRFTF